MRVLDLKGHYRGTPVDVETDPDLYRAVAEAFPGAYLEDPDLNDETRPVLEPHMDRVTWDAPLHSLADIKGLEPARRRSTPSPRASARSRSCSRSTSTASSRESPSTAAARASSARAAGRSSTSPRCSTTTPPTTSPRPATTTRRSRRACPPARWSRRRRRPGSAGPSSSVAADGREQVRRDAERAGRPRVRRLAAVHRDRRPLRRGDPAPARLLLLPPGGRGAKPRDDDHPVPARRRRPGADAGRRAAAGELHDNVAPVTLALEQEKRVAEEIASLSGSPGRKATTSASSSCSGSSRSRSRRSPRCRRC